MTISKDLFLALLSMDSYNRGYGAGISLSDQSETNELVIGGAIGASTIKSLADVGISQEQYDAWQAAGFYAVAYTITDGSKIDGLETGDTVISYRGTDNPDFLGIENGANDRVIATVTKEQQRRSVRQGAKLPSNFRRWATVVLSSKTTSAVFLGNV